jgi:hypothetical protein
MATEHDVIVAALNQVGGLGGDCPVCGGALWTAGEQLHLLPVAAEDEHTPDAFRLGGPPLISSACQSCGHLRYFDATTLLSKI